MKTGFRHFIILMASAAIFGCGPMETNPKADYDEIDQKFIPAQDDVEHGQQAFVPAEIISVRALDESSLVTDITAIFEEGQKNELKFRAQALDPNVSKVTVKSVEAPTGVAITPAKDAEIPNTYRLTWTPTNFIQKNRNYEVVEVKVHIAIASENPDSIDYLKAINKERIIKIIVMPNQQKSK